MTIFLVALNGFDYDSDDKISLSFFVEAGSGEKALDKVSGYTRVRSLRSVTYMNAKTL